MKNKAHLIYKILLSIVIVIAGICLMAACLGIYRTGDQPFSRESVAEAFSTIAIPVYLCLVMVIAAFLLELFLPRPEKKTTPEKNYSLILQRLQEKTDLTLCGDTLRIQINTQRKSRRLHRTISLGMLAVGSIVFLSYGLNPHNFHQSQLNESMIKAMYLLLPCMVIPFGYAVYASYHHRASVQKEISLLKSAPAEAKTGSNAGSVNKTAGKVVYIRYAILSFAIVILVYGFFAGGTADVITKAVNICTECVGLG